MSEKGKKSLFEVGNTTRVIRSLLSDMKEGEVLTYEEISKECGRDVTKKGRGNLRTAVNSLLRHEKASYSTIRNVGIRRDDPSQSVTAASGSMQRVRTAAVKSGRIAEAADVTKLDPDSRSEVGAVLAAAWAISSMATQKAIKEIATSSVTPPENGSESDVLGALIQILKPKPKNADD